MVRLDGLAFHRAARLNGRYAVRRGRARIWPAQKTSTAAIWTVPCRSGRARAFLDAAVDAMAMDAALTERFERFSVGLTGGIGSGKTVVAQRFAQHGVTVIDTDRIAHVLTAAGGAAMPQITRAFGHTYLTAGGALDRAKMREYIFSNLHARRQLEAILHPLIRIECIRAASAARSGCRTYAFNADQWMQNGFKLPPRMQITEDIFAHFGAVERAPGSQISVSEGAGDLGHRRTAGCREHMRDAVCIDDRDAVLSEALRNHRFTAANPAGEAN